MGALRHATFMYMSDTVGIAELRQNLSVYLQRVARGERLIVTDRNRPVAELGPPSGTGSGLDRLIADGRYHARPAVGLPPSRLRLEGDPYALSPARSTRSAASADRAALLRGCVGIRSSSSWHEPETRCPAGLPRWRRPRDGELVLTEVPRHPPSGCRRSAPAPDVLIGRAGELLDAVGLLPLDRALLLAAGALHGPGLRALDAIHVAAAISVSPLDAFLSYDARQAAAARLGGLRTIAPGD